jgi:hypothetical protein
MADLLASPDGVARRPAEQVTMSMVCLCNHAFKKAGDDMEQKSVFFVLV